MSVSIKIRWEEFKIMQKSHRAFLTSGIHCNTIYEVQVTPLPGKEAAGQFSGCSVASRSPKDLTARECDWQ